MKYNKFPFIIKTWRDIIKYLEQFESASKNPNYYTDILCMQWKGTSKQWRNKQVPSPYEKTLKVVS